MEFICPAGDIMDFVPMDKPYMRQQIVPFFASLFAGIECQRAGISHHRKP